MASIRQRVTSAGILGMFFLEHGRVLSQVEYRALNPVPFRISSLKKMYGNWNKAIRFIQNSQPDIWAELQNTENKKPVYGEAELGPLQKVTDALKSKPVKEAVEEE